MSSYIASHRDIQEENEEDADGDTETRHDKQRRDSENFQFPVLNDVDKAKLLSCIDEIRNVVGESVSEQQLVETIMKFKYDATKALDSVLTATTTPPKSLNKGRTTDSDRTIEKGEIL